MTSTTHSLDTVEQMDPHTLVIEANVRPSAPVDAPFVQSIRENGVLMPVFARRDEHGNVLVRMGQRPVAAPPGAERRPLSHRLSLRRPLGGPATSWNRGGHGIPPRPPP